MELNIKMATFDIEKLQAEAARLGVSASDLALYLICREVVHT